MLASRPPSQGVERTSDMRTISAALLGAPLDPFSSQTRQHIALVALLAWIGLGADGLSSSCYGPEEAFLAVGERRGMSVLRLMPRALSYRPARHGSLALEDDQAMNEISFAAPEIAA